MAIDLLNIQPHQVSRDMRGYIVFFYGEEKSGKTTIATRFPQHLLIAFEKGFNAIPGAMAQPINRWSDFKSLLKQLKKPEVQEKFSTIIIDTVDIAYSYCEKYICNNAGVNTIGDIPFGAGYKLLEKEFDECLRAIVQLNYGLVLISHAIDKTFKDENGYEYNQIVPTIDNRGRKVVTRMADIIGYSRVVEDAEGNFSTRLFMRRTPRYVAGSRFRYTPESIEFTYENLVNAIKEAIDKEAEMQKNDNLFTDKINNYYKENNSNELNFTNLMETFNSIIKQLINKNGEEYFSSILQPAVTAIIEKYLGKNKKVGNCTPDQVEALFLIVEDLKELL